MIKILLRAYNYSCAQLISLFNVQILLISTISFRQGISHWGIFYLYPAICKAYCWFLFRFFPLCFSCKSLDINKQDKSCFQQRFFIIIVNIYDQISFWTIYLRVKKCYRKKYCSLYFCHSWFFHLKPFKNLIRSQSLERCF